MAVLTAGVAIKDDLLRKFSGTADYTAIGADMDAADGEYRQNVQYIHEDALKMLSKKTITKKEFDDIITDCRDRKFAAEVAENLKGLKRVFAEGQAHALKHGITEEDIDGAIREVKAEMLAGMEQAESK